MRMWFSLAASSRTFHPFSVILFLDVNNKIKPKKEIMKLKKIKIKKGKKNDLLVLSTQAEFF